MLILTGVFLIIGYCTNRKNGGLMDDLRPNNHNDYNAPGGNGNNSNNNNGNNNKNGNNGNNGSNGNGPNKRSSGQMILSFIMFTLIALFVIALITTHFNESSSKETTYNEFLAQLEAGNVKSVTYENYEIDYKLVDDEGKYDITYYTGYIEDPALIESLKTMKTKNGDPIEFYSSVPDDTSAWIVNILSFAIPLIFAWIFFAFIMKKMGGGAMGVGKSTAKVYVEKSTGVTFKDVAGQDEAKESLQEVVDFLHNPKKYKEIGAKLPKGALLVGPPGTGKTLLAKAVANQTNATFIKLVASEFVNKFLGEGARYVRQVFELAKEKSPAIIFIDEIDAIGTKRTHGTQGADREVQRTLMQLLSELDGFESRGNVGIIAATNRPDILDDALIRPGRFDRTIEVPLPNKNGRINILKIHTEKMKIDENIDFESISELTEGFSGADLKAACTEAGMFAIRNERKKVISKDFMDAIDKIINQI